MIRILRVVRVDTERKRVDTGRKRVDTCEKEGGQRKAKNHKNGASLSLVMNFGKIKSKACSGLYSGHLESKSYLWGCPPSRSPTIILCFLVAWFTTSLHL